MNEVIKKIANGYKPGHEELVHLISHWQEIDTEHLFSHARRTAQKNYGREIFLRCLIEITNYCSNDCLYCGIRRSNLSADRYRLGKDEILSCCARGYALGLRTFVLQGGEDPYFNDDLLCEIIHIIKHRYPDCAVTLSMGERSKKSYEKLKSAGADRYLLRHETADCKHYSFLHPSEMRLESRKKCLYDLKQLGFQVGAGFMVGSPCQTPDTLAKDLEFLLDLNPHMIGIGPFIPHSETPFANENAGSVELTLIMIALTRLLLPGALIPSTTALGTAVNDGIERGILAGANVVMPNFTPSTVRAKYLIYDGKDTSKTDNDHLNLIIRRIKNIGYHASFSRGDHISKKQNEEDI